LEFIESLKAAVRSPSVASRAPRRVARPVTLFGHRPVWIGIAAMLFLALGRWITVIALAPTSRMEAGMVPPLTPVTPEEAATTRSEQRLAPATVPDLAPEPTEPATYEDAYAAAQGDVFRGLRSIGLEGLFSPGRLTNSDSLRATRRDLAAARNVLAVYRSQEVRIDATYDHPRPSRREGYAAAQTVDSMFTMLDSVYAVLLDEEDAYRMSGGIMKFDRASAARRYSRYRSWLRARLGRWADRPSDTVPFTIGIVLRATAGGTLPPSGR